MSEPLDTDDQASEPLPCGDTLEHDREDAPKTPDDEEESSKYNSTKWGILIDKFKASSKSLMSGEKLKISKAYNFEHLKSLFKIQNPFPSPMRWYWPTSVHKTAASELNLLARGGISILKSVDRDNDGDQPLPLDPSHIVASLEDVPIGCGQHIHTLTSSQCSSPDINVVLCHGFGAGLGFYYKNLGHLSRYLKDARVYAIDWLGMGQSSRPSFPKYRYQDPGWQHDQVTLTVVFLIVDVFIGTRFFY